MNTLYITLRRCTFPYYKKDLFISFFSSPILILFVLLILFYFCILWFFLFSFCYFSSGHYPVCLTAFPEPHPPRVHQTDDLLAGISLATRQDEDGDTYVDVPEFVVAVQLISEHSLLLFKSSGLLVNLECLHDSFPTWIVRITDEVWWVVVL